MFPLYGSVKGTRTPAQMYLNRRGETVFWDFFDSNTNPHAMNSKRAYREALSKEVIISELEKSRGTQHSPEVVDTFLKMLEKYPQLWEK